VRALNRAAVVVIGWYKRWISPSLGARCRYLPTCSEYAVLCFERFGFFRALALTAWRILRCNPFSRGGLDFPPGMAEEWEREC